MINNLNTCLAKKKIRNLMWEESLYIFMCITLKVLYVYNVTVTALFWVNEFLQHTEKYFNQKKKREALIDVNALN